MHICSIWNFELNVYMNVLNSLLQKILLDPYLHYQCQSGHDLFVPMPYYQCQFRLDLSEPMFYYQCQFGLDLSVPMLYY